MKKVIFILSILLISMFSFMTKNEALAGYTTGTLIRVRPEPNTNQTSLFVINEKNTVLDIVDDTLYPATPGCSVGWYKINYEGTQGYVCGDFVSIGEPGDNNPDYNNDTFEARVIEEGVFTRKGAGYSYSTKNRILPGANVIILGDKIYTPGDRCSEGWYNIKYNKGETGYICSKYVKTKAELTASDQAYEAELKAKGFPDTYIPYLVKLHQTHPNWIFNANQINLNWDELVRNEASKNVVHKDYINDANIDVYTTRQMIEGAYYILTDAVNAFYLDPRNYLSEKMIFAFETLGYNYNNDNRNEFDRNSEMSQHYYKSIKTMLSSSYLNKDEYLYSFIEAGFKNKVSPIHLVASAIQEGASRESYAAVSGNSGLFYNGQNLNGYYNFFNIGSHEDAFTNSPVARGLAYACGSACGSQFTDFYGQPWNTREKAIFGGAQFLSNEYLSNGQSTLYYKKFDLKGFWHQYMTNILAPIQEGESAYNGHSETGILDSPIEFDIPVYQNMPNSVSLPEIASIVNTLDEIKVDNKVIEGYDKDVIEYTVYVPMNYTSVKVEATKSDNKSSVAGLGAIELKETTTAHQIIVTAESGAKKTYKITIVKVEDTTTVNDILSNLSVKVNGNIMNHIHPETTANTLIQSILKNSPKTTVTVYDSKGTIITGASLLETGGRIRIAAPTETKEFTTVVTGDASKDGKVTILDLLQVQKDIVGSTKLDELAYKAADVSNDGKVTILDLLMIQKYLKGQGSL